MWVIYCGVGELLASLKSCHRCCHLLSASQPLFRSPQLPDTAQETSEGLAQRTGDDFPEHPSLLANQNGPGCRDQGARQPEGLKGDTRNVDQRALVSQKKPTQKKSAISFNRPQARPAGAESRLSKVYLPSYSYQDVHGHQPAGCCQLGPRHQ